MKHASDIKVFARETFGQVIHGYVTAKELISLKNRSGNVAIYTMQGWETIKNIKTIETDLIEIRTAINGTTKRVTILPDNYQINKFASEEYIKVSDIKQGTELMGAAIQIRGNDKPILKTEYNFVMEVKRSPNTKFHHIITEFNTYILDYLNVLGTLEGKINEQK